MIFKEYVTSITVESRKIDDSEDEFDKFDEFTQEATRALDLLPEVEVCVQSFDHTVIVRSPSEQLALAAEKQLTEIADLLDFEIVETAQ